MRRFAKVLADIEQHLIAEKSHTFENRVACYRKAFSVENKWLEMQHRRLTSGLEVARMRSDMLDDFVRHILKVGSESLRKKNGKAPMITVVALGGYGRREQNPQSDVDLTFLHTGGKTLEPGVEDLVKEVLHLLFGCDLTPGHSTRNMDETIAEANKEMQSKTAMLEARLLWGDPDLFRKFQSRFMKECVAHHVSEYLKSRVEDQAMRHSKFGRTVYMQSPNIKNGCGGLRDYQNLLWMTYFKYRVRTTQDLVEKKYLNESERTQLDRAYEFLFRLRTELHYINNRPVDIILLNQQLQLSNRFGYGEKFPDVLRRTEAFMRDYYTHARNIYEITELVSERLALPMVEEPKPHGLFKYVPFRRTKQKQREEFDGFFAIGGKIYYRDRQIFKEDRTRMMRLFLHVQQRGLTISPELRQLVRRRLKYVDNTFRYAKANREIFEDIMSRKGRVGPILRAMHRVDFLGRFLPEFGNLTALVQHEFFHRYTADEHTLVCIEKLDGILDAEEERFAGYKDLFQKLEDTYMLYLALLMHDTGKAANSRAHAEVSATNAQRVARRLQLRPEQRKKLIFLVDNHDVLAKTAQTRDLSDEETIEEFTSIVENQANLDALMLLTVADGLGVGDEVMWNDWKQSLIWQLYRSTSAYLADSDGYRRQREVERAKLREQVTSKLPGDFEDEIAAHFNSMPDRYFLTHRPETIVAHIKLFRQFLSARWNDNALALAPSVKWVHHPNSGHSEIWVVTWDRPHLLARICGALSVAGLNILGADIYTRHDNLVLDIFRVCNTRLEAIDDERDTAKVEKLLCNALEVETFDFAPLFAKTHGKIGVQLSNVIDFPTRITINTSLHPRYTMVEITTPDRMGLLYRLLKALGSAGVQIALSRIATEKGAAIDSFYVTDVKGRKIENREVITQIQTAMQKATDV